MIIMKISVVGFHHDGEIPVKYTCDGSDISPRVTWEDTPDGTKSLALIMDDPDAPMGTFSHWLAYNIPPGENSLEENFPKAEETGHGIRQGKNDFGNIGYGGPCPPRGKPHRYFFKLYALDSDEHINVGIDRKNLESSLKGKIIGEAEYMGTYKRV